MCDNAAVHEGAEVPVSSAGSSRVACGGSGAITTLLGAGPGVARGVLAACLALRARRQCLGGRCSPRSQQGLGGGLLSTLSHPGPRRQRRYCAHFHSMEIKL